MKKIKFTCSQSFWIFKKIFSLLEKYTNSIKNFLWFLILRKLNFKTQKNKMLNNENLEKFINEKLIDFKKKDRFTKLFVLGVDRDKFT